MAECGVCRTAGIAHSGYHARNFPEGQGPLELAYALTIHKAQGSEFRTVFVVLPKNCRLISRELLYTALTRSRDRLVLLIEGDSASVLSQKFVHKSGRDSPRFRRRSWSK